MFYIPGVNDYLFPSFQSDQETTVLSKIYGNSHCGLIFLPYPYPLPQCRRVATPLFEDNREILMLKYMVKSFKFRENFD